MDQEYTYTARVMGCDLFVSISQNKKEKADSIFQNMLMLAELYDKQYSRFLSDSTLSLLNRNGSRTVDAEFLEVVRLGQWLFHETEGAFNPLYDISRFGYDADIEYVRGNERTQKIDTPYNTDVDSIGIDENKKHIQLERGQSLDVGGYLKGYVAEKMASLAHEAAGVIVNMGGDIFTRGVDEQGRPFQFEIENPLSEQESILFMYGNGSIATSGSYKRHWSLAGKTTHHILGNGGLGNPDTDIISATVLSKSGAVAEAFATAALVMGSKRAQEFLLSKQAEYVLICSNGSVYSSSTFPVLHKELLYA